MRFPKKIAMGLISLFKRLGRAFRLGAIGVIFAGILTAIQGCTLEDFLKFLFVLWALGLPGGEAEEPASLINNTIQIFVQVNLPNEVNVVIDSLSVESLISSSTLDSFGQANILGLNSPSQFVWVASANGSIMMLSYIFRKSISFPFTSFISKKSNSLVRVSINESTNSSNASVQLNSKTTAIALAMLTHFLIGSDQNTRITFANQVQKHSQFNNLVELIEDALISDVNTALDPTINPQIFTLAKVISNEVFQIISQVETSEGKHTFAMSLYNTISIPDNSQASEVLIENETSNKKPGRWCSPGLVSDVLGLEPCPSNILTKLEVRDVSATRDAIRIINESSAYYESQFFKLPIGNTIEFIKHQCKGFLSNVTRTVLFDETSRNCSINDFMSSNESINFSILFSLSELNSIKIFTDILMLLVGIPEETIKGTKCITEELLTTVNDLKSLTALMEAATGDVNLVMQIIDQFFNNSLLNPEAAKLLECIGLGAGKLVGAQVAKLLILALEVLDLGSYLADTWDGFENGPLHIGGFKKINGVLIGNPEWLVPTTNNEPDLMVGPIEHTSNVGNAPLFVVFGIWACDKDIGDKLANYSIDFGDGSSQSDSIDIQILCPPPPFFDQVEPLFKIQHTYDLPGTYKFIFVITDSRGAQSANEFDVHALGSSPSNLEVSPTSLSFASQIGSPNPPSQQIDITNIGGGTLNWTASSNQSWLSVSPNSGTVPSSPNVSVNIAGLGIGTHTGAITITATTPGAQNSSQTVNVALTISSSSINSPNTPSNLTITVNTSDRLTLSWDDNSADEDGFRIYRGGTQIAQVGPHDNSDPLKPGFTNSGLNSNTQYCYQVSAFNANGESDKTNEVCATTLPSTPVAPTNLNATTVSSSEINVTWQHPGGVDFYEIQRKTGINGTFTSIANFSTVGSLEFPDSGLDPNTTYCYRIRAVNDVGSSDFSNEDCATTASSSNVPSTPPNAPSGLTTIAGSATTITLSWIDNADNEDGFRIGKRQPPNTNFTFFSLSGADIANFTDGLQAALTPNTEYCYVVKAFNNLGDSAQSNEACATTDSIDQSHPWPMYQHDAQHSGSSAVSGPSLAFPPSDFSSEMFDKGFNGSVAISQNGVVYLGSDDGNLYAFNSNLTKKWIFVPHLEGSTAPLISATNFKLRAAPAIGSDGTIFTLLKTKNPATGTIEAGFYAIKSDGNQKRRTGVDNLLDDTQQASPLIVKSSGKTYVIAASGKKVYAFDSGGEFVDDESFNDTIKASPAFDTITERIYIAAGMRLFCLQLSISEIFGSCPETAWQGGILIESPSSLGTPSIGAYGTIYVQSQENLYAYNATGQQKWQNNGKTQNNCSQAGFTNTANLHLAPVIGSDNTIFVVSSSQLKGFKDTGSSCQPLWNGDGEPAFESNPIIDMNGNIFIADNENLRGVDPATGEEKWIVPLKGKTSSPAFDSFGNIYIGTDDDRLVLIMK